MQLSEVKREGGRSMSTHHSFSTEDPKIEDARVVILDLHDGGQVPREVPALVRHTQEMRDYVTVERDRGIACMQKTLLERIPGSIAIHVHVSRGIVDANRNPPFALSLPFSENVSSRLMQRHSQIQRAIRAILSRSNIKVVIDLHSMSPKTPLAPVPQTTTETLSEHVAYWMEAQKSGTNRSIDLCDSSEDGSLIGNRRLAECIGYHLEQAGFPSVFNKPYAKSVKHHPVDFTQDRGVSVDFPKDLVAGGIGQQFSLLNSRPSMRKIMALIDPIEQSIRQYLSD